MEVPDRLISCLGLEEHAVLRLKVLQDPPVATRVSIEPIEPEDWEAIEANSGNVEEQLRNQISCVYEGLQFPIYTPGRVAARVRVTACQ